MTRTYSELVSIDSFVDRYNYLRIPGMVGEQTFGSTRFLNQDFYRSKEWRRFRNDIIVRDRGCDLAFENREIFGLVIVHHILPITEDMVRRHSSLILDPENAITVSDNTHKAIHYGDQNLLIKSPQLVIRKKNDTIPWRR